MTTDKDDLAGAYADYLACLNRQDWGRLDLHVADDVTYNGRPVGLAGYRDMLIGDFKAIPDLAFTVRHLVCDPPALACILSFDCTPTGLLFDLPVNGVRVRFDEHVFYEYEGARIRHVRSLIDKAAIAAQI